MIEEDMMDTCYTVTISWKDSPWKYVQVLHTIDLVLEFVRKYDKTEPEMIITVEKCEEVESRNTILGLA